MLESWKERKKKAHWRVVVWERGSVPEILNQHESILAFQCEILHAEWPLALRGSFAGRLCLLSIAGVRSVMCHSATNFISSSIVNSRRLLVLYYHNPFFHKNAPFNVASILFNPKFFGIDQILHHNATL